MMNSRRSPSGYAKLQHLLVLSCSRAVVASASRHVTPTPDQNRKNRRICRTGGKIGQSLQIRRFFLKNGKFGTSPMQLAQNCDNPNRSGHPLFLPHNTTPHGVTQTHLARNLDGNPAASSRFSRKNRRSCKGQSRATVESHSGAGVRTLARASTQRSPLCSSQRATASATAAS